MKEFDTITITTNIASNLNSAEKEKFYMQIINGLNDQFINVIKIENEEKEVFNNKQGFIRKEDNND